MLPSSSELVYFLEVSATLNLSRASERLGISQPSLSLAIKRLEESVGTVLFIRHKQGVTLTQAGKQLVFHARQLLHYWENTKAKALASKEDIQGYFTLGCHSSIAIYLLSKVLPSLLEMQPKLEIHLKHDISRHVTEQVINLSIDMGIVVNPFRHPDLIVRKLCSDEVRFWVAEGSKDIQDSHSKNAIILCDPELTQTQALLKKGKKFGVVSDRMMTMNSLEVVASLTANGCGIGILPTRVVKALYQDKLKPVPNTPVYTDEVCLIYRSENREVKAIQTIVKSIKDFFEN